MWSERHVQILNAVKASQVLACWAAVPRCSRKRLDRRRKPRAVLLPDTNPRRFLVKRRPRLANLTDYPELDFADYERRLAAPQSVLQLIQQAYLGSSERALVVLEGWDSAGGGVIRRLGWALDPRSFKVHPISAPVWSEADMLRVSGACRPDENDPKGT